LAEKKTGIRVNELAKELGVESKAILAKLKSEGLGDAAPNHMSRISLGLAESVREWFAHGAGGVSTAVETSAPVDVATVAKPAKPRTRKKKAGDDTPATDDNGGTATAVAEAPPPVRPSRVEAPAPAAPEPEPVRPSVVDEPAAPVAPPPAPPRVEAAPVAPPPPAPVAPPVAAQAPAPAAPPAAAPSAPAHPPAAPHRSGPGGLQPPAARPTVTLANRHGAQPVARAAVTPAPQMVRPAPATMQGPKVIREEKPDVVAAPRPRRTLADVQQGPGYTTARPATGRGVKVSDEEEEGAKKGGDKKKGAASLSARRRGVDGRRGEAMEKLKEFTEADLLERQERLQAATNFRSGFDRHLTKVEQRGTHAQAKTAVQKGEPVEVEEPITVKNLSGALGVKVNDIIRRLMKQGVMATVNQGLDTDTATMIALEYGLELRIKQEPTLEEQLLKEFDERKADTKPEELVSRPPVVTILGHVDHGKTSLLDKIRSANVAAGEAGGITQHTAAWKVQLGEGEDAKRVTFIDTPGHQAFTSMRARGANMTDVVVLVVSAAEGVQPQTVESINHAKAAGVPIVVAMNKIDRPDSQPDMVLGQLAANGLNPVEWGGDIEVVRTSAVSGQGIPELIETLDYQSQLLDLKADPNAPARGVVIESRIDPGLGSAATVLVQDGTLKLGDVVLAGPGYGRIRHMLNDNGKPIREAGPATPVIISGMGELPMAGDKFFVLDDLDRARAIAADRATRARMQQLSGQNRVTADNLLSTIREGDIQTINLIIKADVQGSVETLSKTVTDQNTQEVQVKVIHAGVGAVSESDVELAIATRVNPENPDQKRKVAIIGFNVSTDDAARALAEQNHIDVKLYRVIYEIFDDLKKALSGMLTPEEREKLHGHAEVRQVFKVSKIGNIAGCFVTDGHISRGSRIRLIRDGRVITEDLTIESLKRVKEDAKEVKAGLECGIKLAGYDDIKVGDRFEGYVKETFQRTL
jgi:translation initiation factor IF-2